MMHPHNHTPHHTHTPHTMQTLFDSFMINGEMLRETLIKSGGTDQATVAGSFALAQYLNQEGVTERSDDKSGDKVGGFTERSDVKSGDKVGGFTTGTHRYNGFLLEG